MEACSNDSKLNGAVNRECGSNGTSILQDIETSSSCHIKHVFNFPSDDVGVLIGRAGSTINDLREKSNASIMIKKLIHVPGYHQCIVTGLQSQVLAALALIKTMFPDVDTTKSSSHHTDGFENKLEIPSNVCISVHVCHVHADGHFFVHQPMHETYAAFCRLRECLSLYHDPPVVTQPMQTPLQIGAVGITSLNGVWYRCQVLQVFNNVNKAEIQFVDFGGNAQVNMDEIIQMHDDFTLLPFQASECCLASISPLDGEKCFSEEFVTALEQLTPSSTPVQIQAIDYNDAKPLVNLYTYHNNMMCYVNKELVDMGLAQWTPKNKNSG